MYLILILFLFIVSFLIFIFVVTQFGHLSLSSNVCLVGKTAVVTGGSSGIGYQIVLALASRGCKVIIADRIITEDIKKSIINETNNSNIILEYVDFASFKSVREFATKLNRSEEKIDILVNNVGIGKSTGKLTEDGLNATMQINYYSPFLLTHLLVGLLKNSKQGRIIFTASALSYIHVLVPQSVSSSRIKDPPSFLGMFDYPNSKFCTVTSSIIFAEKLKKWNITSNSYHPGVVKTNIFTQTKEIMRKNVLDFIVYYGIISPLYNTFGVGPKMASQTAVEMIVSKEFKKVTGIFFGKFFPSSLPRGCNNKIFCDKIWKASENTVQLKPEERLD